MARSSLCFATVCVAFLAAGCNVLTSSPPLGPAGGMQRSDLKLERPGVAHHALPTPALIGVSYGGVLKYYPIKPHGGSRPEKIGKIPHLRRAAGMVADGNELAIASQSPPGVVLYDVTTQAQSTLPDPNGIPLDIAIDKNANLFVLNVQGDDRGNVTMYRANSAKAIELNCRYIGFGEAIATDNEGDVFVNGYQQSFTGVVEIPNGPKGPQPDRCGRLDLRPENGYVAGIAVDPKTDDLIVLDDPDLCAGGQEGRMTIYPKPYSRNTAHAVDLNGNCVGQMRLDATSRILFAFDETVSGGDSYILQRGYPGGRIMGSYRRGDLRGIATIPNSLPN
jgi:hypothetical protein